MAKSSKIGPVNQRVGISSPSPGPVAGYNKSPLPPLGISWLRQICRHKPGEFRGVVCRWLRDVMVRTSDLQRGCDHPSVPSHG